MKIIFLDVDGVLCTARSHLVLGYPHGDGIWEKWDALAAEAIRLCCERKGVKIVISSTWRIVDPELLVKRLKEFGLYDHLYGGSGHTDNVTPNLKSRPYNGAESIRGDEIQDWLNRHPEVESYRILDDDSDMLPEQMKKLIHTDGLNGMTHENIQSLFRWCGILKS